MRAGSRNLALAALAAGAVAVLFAAPFIGEERVPLRVLFDRSSGDVASTIFWSLRLPRVLVSLLAGAGLAVSGMAFQAMFRNPLATPFTLGVSSGASLGATIALRLGFTFSILSFSAVSAAAFAGAGAAILLVYGLTRARRGFSAATMLLAGVAVSFFFSSMILLMQYLSDILDSARILRWIMGSLATVGYASTLEMLPFVTAGASLVLYLTHELNLLTTGEDIATSRGVNVARTKHLLFFATSLMVGGVVAVCGPIGFVGMMSPHICRLLIGPDHRYLTPATLLFGAAFLTLCDVLSRTLIAPAEIPVGVITAILGGPFFLWLLLGGKPQRMMA